MTISDTIGSINKIEILNELAQVVISKKYKAGVWWELECDTATGQSKPLMCPLTMVLSHHLQAFQGHGSNVDYWIDNISRDKFDSDLDYNRAVRWPPYKVACVVFSEMFVKDFIKCIDARNRSGALHRIVEELNKAASDSVSRVLD